jgi:hypothetical protein
MLNLHTFGWLALGVAAVQSVAFEVEAALSFIIGLAGGLSLAGSI